MARATVTFFVLILLVVSPLAVHASPASPSFFESLGSWLGGLFVWSDMAKAERNLKQAEAILKDLGNSDSADDEFLLEGLSRYSKRLEKAKAHVERAREKKKDISRLAELAPPVPEEKRKILEQASPALLEKAELLKSEIRTYAEEGRAELEKEKGFACSQDLAPVCGTDGNTYVNRCQAIEANKVQVAYEGACKKPDTEESAGKEVEKACTKEYAPVCGKDGKTYDNACFAERAGTVAASKGACKKESCNIQCLRADPVCGADGKTYTCGNAEVLCNGTKVLYSGECKPAPKPIPPPSPALCPAIYAPVCGKDGKTYSNECVLKGASVAKVSDGACPPAAGSVSVGGACTEDVQCAAENRCVKIDFPNSGGICTKKEDVGDPASPLDLSLKTASIYGVLLVEGNIANFSAVVLNSGTEKIDAEYYTQLFIDSGNDGGFERTMAAFPGSPLAAGESETHIWKSAIVLELGTHAAKICTDTKKAILESSEGNNCYTVAFTVKKKELFPELYVSSVTVRPTSPYVGDPMSFTAFVKNKGVGGSPITHASIMLDKGNDKTPDVSLGKSETSPLAPGASDDEVWNLVWIAEEGYHRVEVCADADLETQESDEANNCASAIFQVLPQPTGGY